MMFTVEEMNLIRAMDHTCRRMAIFAIKTSIPNIEDHELKELCKNCLLYTSCRDRRLQAEALLHRAAWAERYHRSQQAF